MNRCLRAFAALLSISTAYAGTSDREIRATFVESGPGLDGRLDDAAWRSCAFSGGFTQSEPREGEPATFPTEFCVLYDRRNLYVGVRLIDPEPGRIRRALGRRDAQPESDSVAVAIDSYHDHRTGYAFWTNPSAAMADATMSNDSEIDFAWDGVWDVASAIDARGWTAEFRIPLSTLRFDESQERVFGVQIRRRVSRVGETSNWAPRPRTSNAEVSLFGHLAGLGSAQPGLGVELSPYGLIRSTLSRAAESTFPDEKAHAEAGADLKAPIHGTLTLDATLNPDFAQVEVDPEVVNLTAFETFLPEKRPFFLEGGEVLATPIQVFYTRRIGAAPAAPELADAESLEELDPVARIVGATKVTGRQGSTALGVLAAYVDDARAHVRQQDDTLRDQRASPPSLFAVARLRETVVGNSTVGGIVTGLARDREPDAIAGGPDLDWRLGNLQLLAQMVGADGGESSGYAAKAVADYTGRIWGWVVQGDARSPGLDLNDVGFVQQPGAVTAFALGRWRMARPHGPLRESWLRVFTFHGVDYDGFAVQRGLGAEVEEVLMNRLRLVLSGEYAFSARDNFETRGGPAYQRPASWMVNANLSTDASRRVVLGIGGNAQVEDGSPRVGPYVEVTATPWDRFSIGPRLKYSRTRGRTRWVDTVSDAGGDHFVFGDLDLDQVEAQLRSSLSFTRDLTFQLFAQYLHTRQRHDDLRELVAPDAFTAFSYSGGDSRDTSLLFNTVLRWEYLPLSAVYLVWTHRASLSGEAPDFAPLDSVDGAFRTRGDDVVLLKLGYLWQP